MESSGTEPESGSWVHMMNSVEEGVKQDRKWTAAEQRCGHTLLTWLDPQTEASGLKVTHRPQVCSP